MGRECQVQRFNSEQVDCRGPHRLFYSICLFSEILKCTWKSVFLPICIKACSVYGGQRCHQISGAWDSQTVLWVLGEPDTGILQEHQVLITAEPSVLHLIVDYRL